MSPPVQLTVDDLISSVRFRTLGREPVTTTSSSTTTQVIRTTTADGSDDPQEQEEQQLVRRRIRRAQPQHTQLSSDYCRYVSRSSYSGGGSSHGGPSPVDFLSESTLEQMRQQVRHQRLKVEEESRRHHHYHSQRSARNTPPVDLAALHQQQAAQLAAVQKLKQSVRPVSSYYDGSPTYETIQHNGGSQRKTSLPSSPVKQQQQQNQNQANWNGTAVPTIQNHGSIRSRGPFVTQVQIQNQMSYQ